MLREFDAPRSSIREVLLNDWDPHNVTGRAEAHGAYDGWVDSIHELLMAGPEVERVMDWLSEREAETMCFPSLGRERLRRVAMKLLALPEIRRAD